MNLLTGQKHGRLVSFSRVHEIILASVPARWGALRDNGHPLRGGLVIDDPDEAAYPDTLIRIRPRENTLLSRRNDPPAVGRHRRDRCGRTLTAGRNTIVPSHPHAGFERQIAIHGVDGQVVGHGVHNENALPFEAAQQLCAGVEEIAGRQDIIQFVAGLR